MDEQGRGKDTGPVRGTLEAFSGESPHALERPRARDRRMVLSTLWIFVLFNYVYADVAMMNFSPATYAKAAAVMGPGLILAVAALMEIPIAMILLSRVLGYRANRWANLLAGVEGTAWVALTLSGGTPPAFYIFIAAIEMACTAFIAWYAWTWREPADRAASQARPVRG